VEEGSFETELIDRASILSLGHSSTMATLTKSQPALLDDDRITLSSSIPAPFSSADRDYILHSHTNSLHHSVTPSPIAPEHLLHAQESQVVGEDLLNADRTSPAIQVSGLQCLHP